MNKDLKIVGAALLISIAIYFTMALLFSWGFSYEYESSFLISAIILLIVAFIINNTSTAVSAIMLIAGIFLFSLIYSPVFMSGDFVRLVTVKEANLSNFNTDPKMVRKVTKTMALKKANKVIGIKENGVQLSSQFEIDTNGASAQMVNGELIWVFPLDYSGLTKWLNSNNVPGYITVSATDPNAEAKLALNHAFKASNGGYFGDSIARKMWWISGMKKVSIHMEVSDNGTPYWIGAVIEPTIGFSGDTVTRVIVFNGENEQYEVLSIEEANSKYQWIDRIWPESIIQDRIEWYGKLKKGWLNSVFTQENVSEPTLYHHSNELWLVSAGESLKWFTGMTSVNTKDQSLVSGVFVSTKSGKPVLNEVNMSGVTDENGAIEAIESGLGADSVKWKAVLPQPVFYRNSFYWSASIVSKSGLFQKVGVVKGQDISDVHYAKILSEALEKDFSGNKISSHINTREEIIKKIMQKIDELNELKKQLQSMK